MHHITKRNILHFAIISTCIEFIKCYCLSLNNLIGFLFIILGVCLCVLVSGKDAINTVADFASQNNLFHSESVFFGESVNQVRELTGLIFDGKITGNNGKKKKSIRTFDILILIFDIFIVLFDIPS